MIKRTHRRLAAVAGVALAVGFAAPASAIFVGATSGTFLNVNLDTLSVTTNIPANLPNDLDPVTTYLEGEVETGLVDALLDRVIGQGDVLTELTGPFPVVLAPLVTGPVLTGATVPVLLGPVLTAPGSILGGVSLPL